jgi:hypothetical protein
MSKPENPSVFPLNPLNDPSPGAYFQEPGISLRDHFAGQALIGQLAFSPRDEFEKVHHPVDVAELAYWFADAMLAERQKGAAA